jgi:hypothetical protein
MFAEREVGFVAMEGQMIRQAGYARLAIRNYRRCRLAVSLG